MHSKREDDSLEEEKEGEEAGLGLSMLMEHRFLLRKRPEIPWEQFRMLDEAVKILKHVSICKLDTGSSIF